MVRAKAYFFHHFRFAGENIALFDTVFFECFEDFLSERAQLAEKGQFRFPCRDSVYLGAKKFVHQQCTFGRRALGKGALGHHAVLVHQVDQHIPLTYRRRSALSTDSVRSRGVTSVDEQVLQKVLYQSTVHRLFLFRQLDHRDQEVMASLDLRVARRLERTESARPTLTLS